VSTEEDLALLPGEVGTAAKVLDVGEAEWPPRLARRAINALADAGLVLRGLDYQRYDVSGLVVESDPITLYEPDGRDDVERSRQRLLEGLACLRAGDMPVIVWNVRQAKRP
jgi:hypothetical protein